MALQIAVADVETASVTGVGRRKLGPAWTLAHHLAEVEPVAGQGVVEGVGAVTLEEAAGRVNRSFPWCEHLASR